MVSRVPLVLTDLLELPEPLVSQDYLEPLEQRGPRVFKEQPEWLEARGIMERRDNPEHRVLGVLMGPLGLVDQQGRSDLRANKGLPAHRVQQDLSDPQDFRARWDRRVTQAPLDPSVDQGRVAYPVMQAPRGSRALTVSKGLKVLRATGEPRG